MSLTGVVSHGRSFEFWKSAIYHLYALEESNASIVQCKLYTHFHRGGIQRNVLEFVPREVQLNVTLNTSPVETVKIQGITNVIVLLDDKILLLCLCQCIVFVLFQLARRFLTR